MQSQHIAHNAALLQLMRLSSPSLPIGAFAYSQGLEYACDQEWITNELTALDWIAGLLRNSQTYLDVPVIMRLYSSWQENSIEKIQYWSKFLLTSRESKELYDEDQYLGKALAKLLSDLDIKQAGSLHSCNYVSYATAYTLAATSWNIEKIDCCLGYLWAWCESQVNAAIKLIPLGQTAGQRMISQLIDEIPQVVDYASKLHDDEIGSTAIGLGIASAKHETQYSRLFRS